MARATKEESVMRGKSSSFVLAVLLLPGTQALAQGDVTAGKTVFENQCASCHSTEPGRQGFGPSLAALIGRQSGTLPGFNYTPAMVNAHLTWDAKTLDEFLASSTQKVPGTSMPVSLPNAGARADVIAYLGTLGHAAAFAPTPATTTAIAPVGQGPSQDELLRAASETRNWLNASKDYAGQRFVDLNQINTGNAAGLRAVCIYRANSGAAIKDGRVIRGTADGYLIAVDREKGTLLWSRKIADAGKSQYLSMPPLIVGDLVIYGPAGADWGAKNWIGAFKLENGDEVWRFNLIPDANEPGAETWTNPQAREHGGGSIWTPLSFDAENNVVFVPVGNPAPDFYREVRPGINLYTDSVVALDVKTGTLLWYKQFVANDMHDWDLSQVSPIFRASVNGKQRNLMAVSGKDGLLRMLDRDTRELLYE